MTLALICTSYFLMGFLTIFVTELVTDGVLSDWSRNDFPPTYFFVFVFWPVIAAIGGLYLIGMLASVLAERAHDKLDSHRENKRHSPEF